MNHHV